MTRALSSILPGLLLCLSTACYPRAATGGDFISGEDAANTIAFALDSSIFNLTTQGRHDLIGPFIALRGADMIDRSAVYCRARVQSCAGSFLYYTQTNVDFCVRGGNTPDRCRQDIAVGIAASCKDVRPVPDFILEPTYKDDDFTFWC